MQRTYRQRTGTVLACVVIFGAMTNVGATATKGCAAGSCAGKGAKSGTSTAARGGSKSPGEMPTKGVAGNESTPGGDSSQTEQPDVSKSPPEVDGAPPRPEAGLQDLATVLDPALEAFEGGQGSGGGNPPTDAPLSEKPQTEDVPRPAGGGDLAMPAPPAFPAAANVAAAPAARRLPPFQLRAEERVILPAPRNPASATQRPLPRASGATGAAAAGHSHPIYELSLANKDQIGQAEATRILQATGIMKNGSFTQAIGQLRRGYTYGAQTSGAFDAAAREMLFTEYQQMRRAVDKWGRHPTISESATPQLYDGFLRSASARLTALPEADRYSFIKALTTQESTRTHWVNGVPVIGGSGAAGFGQLLPRTAQSYGRNRYDPEQNLITSATYVNGLIAKYGLREGLARYNGGTEPPAFSYRGYADQILARWNRSRRQSGPLAG